MPTNFVTLLYTSRAVVRDPNILLDIALTAREHNAMHGVTGVLLYDGECFAQLIEGPADSIAQLHGNLTKDVRHRGLVTLFLGLTGDLRRFPSWRLGYLDVTNDADRLLSALEGAEGLEAIQRFDELAHDIGDGPATALPTEAQDS